MQATVILNSIIFDKGRKNPKYHIMMAYWECECKDPQVRSAWL
jgi:hypothetical protein